MLTNHRSMGPQPPPPRVSDWRRRLLAQAASHRPDPTIKPRIDIVIAQTEHLGIFIEPPEDSMSSTLHRPLLLDEALATHEQGEYKTTSQNQDATSDTLSEEQELSAQLSDATSESSDEQEPCAQSTSRKKHLFLLLLAIACALTDYAEDAIEASSGLSDKAKTQAPLIALFNIVLTEINDDNLATITDTIGPLYATAELILSIPYIRKTLEKESIFPLENPKTAAFIFTCGAIRIVMLGTTTFFFMTDPDDGLGWQERYATPFAICAMGSCALTQIRPGYDLLSDVLHGKYREYDNEFSRLLTQGIATPLAPCDTIGDVILGYVAMKGVFALFGLRSSELDWATLGLAACASIPFACVNGEIIRDAHDDFGKKVDAIIELIKSSCASEAVRDSSSHLQNYATLTSLEANRAQRLQNYTALLALKDILLTAGSYFLASILANIIQELMFSTAHDPKTTLPNGGMPELLEDILSRAIEAAIASRYTYAIKCSIDYSASLLARAAIYTGKKAVSCSKNLVAKCTTSTNASASKSTSIVKVSSSPYALMPSVTLRPKIADASADLGISGISCVIL